MNLRTSLNAAYLLITGLSIIGVLLVFTVFKQMYQANQAKRAQYATSQQAYADNVAFLDSIDRKKAELDADVAQERALSVALPASDQAEDVTRILQRSADDSGVILKKLNNTSLESQRDQTSLRASGSTVAALPEHVVPQSMQLELSGTYAQIRVFIAELSKAPRIIDVLSFTLARAVTPVDQMTIQMTIQFYSYRAN